MQYSVAYKKDSYEKGVGIIIGTFLCINIINLALRQMTDLPQYLISGILGFFYFLVFLREFKFLKRKKVFFNLFAIEVFLFVLIILSCIRYPNYSSEIMSRCIWTVFFCAPLLIICKKVENREVVLLQTIKPSMLVVVVSLFIFYYHYLHGAQQEYSMTIGYALLFPTLLFWHFRGRKKMYLVFFLGGMLLILVYGSRGPMLCVFLFLVMTILMQRSSVKAIVLKVLFIVVVLFIILNLNDLVSLIFDHFMALGIRSRSLSLFLEGLITNDSGRLSIYSYFSELIVKQPIIGYGVASDIPIVGFYPHNLFLEIAFDYGLIVGGALCVIVLFKIVSDLIKQKEENRKISFLFFCATFIPLMLSGTYLQSPLIWVYMGLCNHYECNSTNHS